MLGGMVPLRSLKAKKNLSANEEFRRQAGIGLNKEETDGLLKEMVENPVRHPFHQSKLK